MVVVVGIDLNWNGEGLPDDHKQRVDHLRKQAFALQERFELAEQSAFLLDEMLGDEKGNVAASIINQYEAYAFGHLRGQLFRILVVDLLASVLDETKGSSSIRWMLKRLRKKDVRDALCNYYTHPGRFTVSSTHIEPNEGAEEIGYQQELALSCRIQRSKDLHDATWSWITKNCDILNGGATKRMKWARDKSIAHLSKTEDGIVALDDDPPHGHGKLTWVEPINFLKDVKPLAYKVFLFVTHTSWGDADNPAIAPFSAKRFWDRFKNGQSDLRDFPLYPGYDDT